MHNTGKIISVTFFNDQLAWKIGIRDFNCLADFAPTNTLLRNTEPHQPPSLSSLSSELQILA